MISDYRMAEIKRIIERASSDSKMRDGVVDVVAPELLAEVERLKRKVRYLSRFV